MLLHNLQLILFRVANNLLHYILNSLDEVLELHLVGIGLIPHDLHEN